jgi:hypothetical protein
LVAQSCFSSCGALDFSSTPDPLRAAQLPKRAGNWGFRLTGTLVLPTGAVPVGAVGTLTVDAGGNISGKEASDCTATGIVNVYEPGTLVRISGISLVFDDNWREWRLVQQSLTLPDGTNFPVVLTR